MYVDVEGLFENLMDRELIDKRLTGAIQSAYHDYSIHYLGPGYVIGEIIFQELINLTIDLASDPAPQNESKVDELEDVAQMIIRVFLKAVRDAMYCERQELSMGRLKKHR